MNGGYNSRDHNNSLSTFTSYDINRIRNSNNMNDGTSGFKVLAALFGLIALVCIVFFAPDFLEGKKTYTVTFMDLEGVYLIRDRLEPNSTISEPAQPVKTGYQFLGWFLDNDLYQFGSPINSDLYLRAKWLNTVTNVIEEVQIPEPTPKTNKSNGKKSNVKPTSNPNPTDSNPQPTPVPTPLPTPAPNARAYFVMLESNAKFSDDTTNSKLEPGQKIEIYADLKNNYTDTNYTGNTSCASDSDVGNTYYKLSHTYSVKSWKINTVDLNTKKVTTNTLKADGNKLLYTIPEGDSYISADIEEKTTQVEKHECYSYNASSGGTSFGCSSGDSLDGNMCIHTASDVRNVNNVPKGCSSDSECPNGSMCAYDDSNTNKVCRKKVSKFVHYASYDILDCCCEDTSTGRFTTEVCSNPTYDGYTCQQIINTFNGTPPTSTNIRCWNNVRFNCNADEYPASGACYKYVPGDYIYLTSCDDGYTLQDGKCYKQMETSYQATSSQSGYSCPNGGTLKDTKCYNVREID